MYSWDEIRAAGDCDRYMREVLGQPMLAKGRFNCPWRVGSDSGGMNVRKSDWYDHVEKVGGGILDLCARARHNGDLMAASEELGQWLGLTRKSVRPAAVSGMSVGQEVVATYDYTDRNGKLLAQKLRIEPGKDGRKKDFRWRSLKDGGGWQPTGLESPVLYRLPDILNSTKVIICEGEKDADLVRSMGYTATTTPDGAGKWHENFTSALRGRDLIILCDNDDPGQQHANLIVAQMRSIAKSVRVLTPSREAKGDISSWHMDNFGPDIDEKFAALLTTAEEASGPDPVEVAKDLNREPLANYRKTWEPDDKGRLKEQMRPKTARELIREVHCRFLGFPRVVGTTMFDVDRDTREVRFIRNDAALAAWMGEKSKHPLLWGKIEGAVSMAALYESLISNAMTYQLISSTPSYPKRDDVYYLHDKLPSPTADCKYFEELCNFFQPATQEDASWIRVFFATIFYFDSKAPERPLWVIDSVCGQGAGKSTLIEIAAYLLGADIDSNSPIVVPFKAVNNETQGEQITRRILSASGRRKRLLLLDNVCGEFTSPELASWVTSPSITGRAPYGKGEETRPNDLTYCLTANSAVLDADLAKRSVFVYLDRPNLSPDWKHRVKGFIDKHRLQIIADIFSRFNLKATWDAPFAFRMAAWDRAIMRPLVTEDMYHRMIEINMQRQGSANVDEDIADRIRSKFDRELASMGIHDTDVAFIQSAVAVAWVREVFREEKQAMTSTMITQRLINYTKTGEIPELSRHWKKWPHNGDDRKRGFEWNHSHYIANVTEVHVIGFNRGQVGIVR